MNRTINLNHCHALNLLRVSNWRSSLIEVLVSFVENIGFDVILNIIQHRYMYNECHNWKLSLVRTELNVQGLED